LSCSSLEDDILNTANCANARNTVDVDGVQEIDARVKQERSIEAPNDFVCSLFTLVDAGDAHVQRAVRAANWPKPSPRNTRHHETPGERAGNIPL